jgi:RimJ/RimL family protein N-acetyltransferase
MTPFEVTDGVVLLSTPTSDDVGRIAELCEDAEVARWTTIPSPYQPSDAEWFIAEVVDRGWADGTAATWGVRDPSTGLLCGMVAVDLVGDAEIGFWMGAGSRGQGWMTRAARLACSSAFSHGVDHVRWKALVGNEASLQVATRVGFRQDGTVRRLVLQRGQWRDGWIGTLLPHELR